MPENTKMFLGDRYDPIQGMQRRNEAVENFVEKVYSIPDEITGLIIGRGGEQIKRLRSETGCRIKISPKIDGDPNRRCTLFGTRESIKAAKSMIEEIISTYHSGHFRHGQRIIEMMIPGLKVGLLIGKGGENIKHLQEKCGVKMVIIQDGPEQTMQDKPLWISGVPENVEFAEQMVTDFLAKIDTELSVPTDKCGLVIGKGGKTLQNINQQSGAHVMISKGVSPNPHERIVKVKGDPEQIELAKYLLRKKVEGNQSGTNVVTARRLSPNPYEQRIKIKGYPEQIQRTNYLFREGFDETGQDDNSFFPSAIVWMTILIFLGFLIYCAVRYILCIIFVSCTDDLTSVNYC